MYRGLYKLPGARSATSALGNLATSWSHCMIGCSLYMLYKLMQMWNVADLGPFHLRQKLQHTRQRVAYRATCSMQRSILHSAELDTEAIVGRWIWLVAPAHAACMALTILCNLVLCSDEIQSMAKLGRPVPSLEEQDLELAATVVTLHESLVGRFGCTAGDSATMSELREATEEIRSVDLDRMRCLAQRLDVHATCHVHIDTLAHDTITLDRCFKLLDLVSSVDCVQRADALANISNEWCRLVKLREDLRRQDSSRELVYNFVTYTTTFVRTRVFVHAYDRYSSSSSNTAPTTLNFGDLGDIRLTYTQLLHECTNLSIGTCAIRGSSVTALFAPYVDTMVADAIRICTVDLVADRDAKLATLVRCQQEVDQSSAYRAQLDQIARRNVDYHARLVSFLDRFRRCDWSTVDLDRVLPYVLDIGGTHSTDPLAGAKLDETHALDLQHPLVSQCLQLGTQAELDEIFVVTRRPMVSVEWDADAGRWVDENTEEVIGLLDPNHTTAPTLIADERLGNLRIIFTDLVRVLSDVTSEDPVQVGRRMYRSRTGLGDVDTTNLLGSLESTAGSVRAVAQYIALMYNHDEAALEGALDEAGFASLSNSVENVLDMCAHAVQIARGHVHLAHYEGPIEFRADSMRPGYDIRASALETAMSIHGQYPDELAHWRSRRALANSVHDQTVGIIDNVQELVTASFATVSFVTVDRLALAVAQEAYLAADVRTPSAIGGYSVADQIRETLLCE